MCGVGFSLGKSSWEKLRVQRLFIVMVTFVKVNHNVYSEYCKK